MNKRSLIPLLLWLSLIPLSGNAQGSKPPKDSLTCYTPTELLGIADALTDGAMADSLLKIANLTIKADSNAIKSQKKTIEDQDLRYLETEHLVDECENDKTALKAQAKKDARKLKWTKVGWAATAVAEAVLVVYFMIKP